MLVQLEAVAVELHLVDPRGGVKRRGGPARQSRRWNCQLKFSRNSRVYTLLSRNPPGTHRPPVPLVTAAVSASIHTVRVRFANLPATSLPTPVEIRFLLTFDRGRAFCWTLGSSISNPTMGDRRLFDSASTPSGYTFRLMISLTLCK